KLHDDLSSSGPSYKSTGDGTRPGKRTKTVKSTPPATRNNAQTANKCKRVLEDSIKDMFVSNTTKVSEENHFTVVETTGVKEVEMVDVETVVFSDHVNGQNGSVGLTRTPLLGKSGKQEKRNTRVHVISVRKNEAADEHGKSGYKVSAKVDSSSIDHDN
nr:hypothetical protein [Tanacetum cinerariifolium]